MKTQVLGQTGLRVPPLAFGGNVFGWTLDQQASFTILDALLERGLTFIDTANVYSYWVPGNDGTESEQIIGAWMKTRGVRDRMIIATKCGHRKTAEPGLSAQAIERSVEASLKRLNLDCIDLYQSHYDDPGTALEETMLAFDRLLQAGKVRALGASNYSADCLTESLRISKELGIAAYQTLQPEYNLVEREHYETTLAPLVQQEGLAVICYYALASGFLSGKYRSQDDVAQHPRGAAAGKYLHERGWRVLRVLDDIAEETGASHASIALAWLMSRPNVSPIASATTVEQVQVLAEAVELELSTDALGRLTEASRWDR